MTHRLRHAPLSAPPGAPSPAGERVGLAGVLDALDQQAHHADVPGRAVEWGLAWSRRDVEDRQWWPQGLTSSAYAAPPWQEHRLLLAAWYRKGRDGSHRATRVSVVDVGSLRYRHVELVRPTREGWAPLRVHAGGLAWTGDHLLVAATRRGLGVARLDDLVRVRRGWPRDDRFVLPVTSWLHAEHDDDEEPLRYSFCDVVQREHAGPRLLVGEYGRGDASRRLVELPLDPATGLPLPGGDRGCEAHPLPGGPARMQGVAEVAGVHHVASSNGVRVPGTLHVGPPGRLRARRGVLPPGPEDLTWWPQTGLLWSQTEHPGQRWVFTVRPSG